MTNEKLTNEEKLDNYNHAIYMGEEMLKTILLHECSFRVDSLTDAHLEGEARGIRDMLYRLTKEDKYQYTLQQLEDEYMQERGNKE